MENLKHSGTVSLEIQKGDELLNLQLLICLVYFLRLIPKSK